MNDLINTLPEGTDGLVLAAETAVGDHPVETARMMSLPVAMYERSTDGYRTDDFLGAHPLASRS